MPPRPPTHVDLSGSPAATAAPAIDAVIQALQRLRFGVIHLTVHDGKVVQLDVTERRRFT